MPEIPARLVEALADRYRIERELGEGGMATVYLADDLKHRRKVALKVLKPELAAMVGADRFLAEIQTTANLQHPHILPLFDSGQADGFLYFVMPWIDGETLQDRLQRERQLPVDEALRIARAVASALQAAHDHGVVHRDIKPANILLSRGEPMVADFGIALAVGAAGGGRLTETGLSVGTPYYMSPEQATGDSSIGPPSDLYALACVLYEMLVGEPPFVGNTAQAVLGKILQGDPAPVTAVRRSVPLHVEAALSKALERLPADRFSRADDFARALADPGFRYGPAAGDPARAGSGPWRALALAAGAAAVVGFGIAGWALYLRPPPPRPPLQVAVSFPDDQRFTDYGSFDLSPDGSFIVYQGPSEEGGAQLWMRRWSELDATPLPGTRGAVLPAISPDGNEVAFQSSGFPLRAMRILPLAGGATRTLTDSAWCCITWDGNDQLYFTGVGRILDRIQAGGGTPEHVIAPPPGHNTWAPFVFAEGRRAVQSAGSAEGDVVQGVDLTTGRVETLAFGSDPMVTSTGHLLYVTPDRGLVAVPLDEETLTLTGRPRTVANDLLDTGDQIGHYAVSADADVLVYRRRPVEGRGFKAGWLAGDALEVIDPNWTVDFNWDDGGVAVSPDGDRVAVGTWTDDNSDVVVKQLPTGPAIRLTLSDSADVRPAWTPDGRFVSFISDRDGSPQVYRRRADGSAQTELLYRDPRGVSEATWSPDGVWLVYATPPGGPDGGDILGIRPGIDAEPRVLVESPFRDRHPAISADGRWLAYASDESGRFEVFLRPFPNTTDQRISVSSRGGSSPRWGDSGTDLYYVAGDEYALIGVVRTELAIEPPYAHRETVVSDADDLAVWALDAVPMYDVEAGTDRVFTMLAPGSELDAELVLVRGFADRLRAAFENGGR